MFISISWALLGALIGMHAAERRGFNLGAGFLAGLLLGPFAAAMYLVDSSRVRCPQCAEWIEMRARICPHCRTDVPQHTITPAAPAASARQPSKPGGYFMD